MPWAPASRRAATRPHGHRPVPPYRSPLRRPRARCRSLSPRSPTPAASPSGPRAPARPSTLGARSACRPLATCSWSTAPAPCSGRPAPSSPSKSGNLVLKNSVAGVLWQSFDHPTDNVVKSQSFASGMKLTSGPYVFTIDRATGNLMLRWATVAYFDKGYNSTFTAKKTLSSPTLKNQDADQRIVSLTDGTLSAPVVVAYSSNYGESGDMLRFVRFDSDGNFGAYSAGAAGARRPSSGRRWREVFGYCGNMGVCCSSPSPTPASVAFSRVYTPRTA